jgi:glycosyltransferase involved in cell wall biosynthesis
MTMGMSTRTTPRGAAGAGQSRATILVGVVDPRQAGGVYAAEHAFLESLERGGKFRISTIPFGSRPGAKGGVPRLLRLLRDVAGFRRALSRERPSLVHLNSAFNRQTLLRDTLYALVARKSGSRLFIKFHGSDVRVLSSMAWRRMARRLVGLCAAVGVLSLEEKEHFKAAGCREDRFAIVKNAVDVQRFLGSRGVRRSGNRLLFIARLIPPKGLAETIAALRLLTDEGRDLELVCVGDGPQMEEARRLADRLSLSARIRFTGQIPEEETTSWYRSSGMLVFPTYHQEGFPMTLFHAVAAGLPVVTTRIRAAADYLREPDNCLWVEPRNPSNLAEKIAGLLDNPALCASMERNNRRLAASFTPDRITLEYSALYARLLAGDVARSD